MIRHCRQTTSQDFYEQKAVSFGKGLLEGDRNERADTLRAHTTAEKFGQQKSYRQHANKGTTEVNELERMLQEAFNRNLKVVCACVYTRNRPHGVSCSVFCENGVVASGQRCALDLLRAAAWMG